MADSQPHDPVQSSDSLRKSEGTAQQTDTSFQMAGPEAYVASLAVSVPNTPLEHARHLLVGQPIPETLASRERLNRVQALATLSSDALSSVAYGTHASLAVLGCLGIRRYYSRPRLLQVPERVTRQADVIILPIFSHQELRSSRTPAAPPPVGAPLHPWQQAVAQELAYAAQLAPTLLVVEVVTDRSEADAFCASWRAFLRTQEVAPLQERVTVKALISPYRAVVWPMVHFLEWLSQHAYASKRVAILMPRETRAAWWEWPLQRHVAALVRRHLKRDTALTVIDLPYRLG